LLLMRYNASRNILNEVHRLIEDKKRTFLLTGSSARKMRRGKANLLAGRVWEARLFPLTWKEIPDFDLNKYLRYGGLPPVYLSKYPEEELDAYVNTYLKEEIMAEGLIRKLPPFSRFLRSIALANGEMINFTKIANDCQVPPSPVTEYVGLLEDTLVRPLNFRKNGQSGPSEKTLTKIVRKFQFLGQVWCPHFSPI
jgi:uncharacterized protein